MEDIVFIVALFSTGAKFTITGFLYMLTRKYKTPFLKYTFIFLVFTHFFSITEFILRRFYHVSGNPLLEIVLFVFILVNIPIQLYIRFLWSYQMTGVKKLPFHNFVIIGGTALFTIAGLFIYFQNGVISLFIPRIILSSGIIYSIIIIWTNIKNTIEKGLIPLMRVYCIYTFVFVLVTVSLGVLSTILKDINFIPIQNITIEGALFILNILLLWMISNYHLQPRDNVDGLMSDRIVEIFALTPRESEITLLILKGMQSKEIADTLFLSHHTVKNYITQVYSKVSVKSRFELINRIRNIDDWTPGSSKSYYLKQDY